MSDPYAAQGGQKSFVGGLGGQSAIVTPLDKTPPLKPTGCRCSQCAGHVYLYPGVDLHSGDDGATFDGTYWYRSNRITRGQIDRYDYPTFANRTTIVGGSLDVFYPTLDFAGNLYCIDYSHTYTAQTAVLKVALSGPTVTLLATLPGGVSGTDSWGLIYHPVTQTLYAQSFENAGVAEVDKVWSIHPSTGATATVLTRSVGPAAGLISGHYLPVTITPDAIWGCATTDGTHTTGGLWRLTVPAYSYSDHSFPAGVNSGQVRSAGVGMCDGTILVDLVTGIDIYPRRMKPNFSSTPHAPPCLYDIGPAAGFPADRKWRKVAWPLSGSSNVVRQFDC